jgi:filamentous hemagglutinin family protein
MSITQSGVQMNIDQQSKNAVLNWQSFDIGKQNVVQFNQPDASSIAVNKVNASAAPTKILGQLNANGQVYVLNPNGILFGKDAKVNTGSIVASSLNFNEVVLTEGFTQILKTGNPAAFLTELDAGAITIMGEDGEGAVITADKQGKVFLLAPIIENGGTIETDSGQIIFGAAEDKVYLNSTVNSGLRGFLIEVDKGGIVRNLGKVIASEGNVTFAGQAINQDGIVKATTSVSLEGSIVLKATENVDPTRLVDTTSWESGTVSNDGGTLNFGSSSLTEVVPDSNSATTIDGQKQTL